MRDAFKLHIVIILGIVTLAALFVLEGVHADGKRALYLWKHTTPVTDSIASRFATPDGYTRTTQENRSFGTWLRGLPLLPDGSPVLLHDGTPKWSQDVHAAVIDIDVGKRDLQQCADAVMRLRAEYLLSAGKGGQICFRFTNGSRAAWADWSRGMRPTVKGNKVTWTKAASTGGGYKTFRQYMKKVFQYAGTASLEKELRPMTDDESLQPGDVFIEGGFPGHGVIVLDTAEDRDGNQVFLLGQSYMPAQQVHILVNPNDSDISPWYRYHPGEALRTPEWGFDENSLRRFPARGCQKFK